MGGIVGWRLKQEGCDEPVREGVSGVGAGAGDRAGGVRGAARVRLEHELFVEHEQEDGGHADGDQDDDDEGRDDDEDDAEGVGG